MCKVKKTHLSHAQYIAVVYWLTKYLFYFTQIQWEKNITLSDSPGFLHNWWRSVLRI